MGRSIAAGLALILLIAACDNERMENRIVPGWDDSFTRSVAFVVSDLDQATPNFQQFVRRNLNDYVHEQVNISVERKQIEDRVLHLLEGKEFDIAIRFDWYRQGERLSVEEGVTSLWMVQRKDGRTFCVTDLASLLSEARQRLPGWDSRILEFEVKEPYGIWTSILRGLVREGWIRSHGRSYPRADHFLGMLLVSVYFEGDVCQAIVLEPDYLDMDELLLDANERGLRAIAPMLRWIQWILQTAKESMGK